MKVEVTYTAANGKTCTVVLEEYHEKIVRGTKVICGLQKIRGTLVKRTIALDELIETKPLSLI